MPDHLTIRISIEFMFFGSTLSSVCDQCHFQAQSECNVQYYFLIVVAGALEVHIFYLLFRIEDKKDKLTN